MASSSVRIAQVQQEINALVKDAHGITLIRESVKRFVMLTERMQVIFEQLGNIYKYQEFPSTMITALDRIEDEIRVADEAFVTYKPKSHFYLLTHSQTLNKTMEEVTQSMGQWLSLIPIADNFSRELKNKINELSTEMQQAKYQVTTAEEILCSTLAEQSLSTRLDMAIVGNLGKELVRLIGMDPEMNKAELLEHLRLLRKEIIDCKKDPELSKMETINRIFQHVTAEPHLTRMYSFNELSGEDDPLQAFESFMCPLTKQIMKEPVMIQSELTYERSGIETWFQTCRAQGRQLTCPVTGLVLSSDEAKLNLMLKQTIEEWSHRNATIRINKAVSTLSGIASHEEIESSLDSVLRICEDSPSTKYKVKSSGIIPLILNLWQKKMPQGSHIRSKALTIFQRIAVQDVSEQANLIEAGVLKAAVKSLGCSHTNEIESAVRLLLEISKQADNSKMIGNQKGALIHLLAISSNTSATNATVSALAEQILMHMEQVDSNVIEMAEAGRIEPLLAQLCNGSEETKIQMANYLAEKAIISTQKEMAAKRTASVLVDMVGNSSRAREAGIGALTNLSYVEENIPRLIKAGVLPVLTSTLFAVPTSSNPLPATLKNSAADALSNIAFSSGSWESVAFDADGNTLQSEFFIHQTLGLLTCIGASWNCKVLKILHGIASSPQAADQVAKHFHSGNGIPTLLALMKEDEVSYRTDVLNILNLLSSKLGTEVAQDDDSVRQLKEIVKEKSMEDVILAASVLSSIPLSEAQVVNVLNEDMVRWIVKAITESKRRRVGSSRMNTAMVESLLGLLVQFSKSSDISISEALRMNRVMGIFKENLQLHNQALTKQRAALGIKLLSSKSFSLLTGRKSGNSAGKGEKSGNSTGKEAWARKLMTCFSPSLISSSPLDSDVCTLHKRRCCVDDDDMSFCLRESNATRVLIELVGDDDEDRRVQIAAVEALSTLFSGREDESIEAGVEEIARCDGIVSIMDWFKKLRSRRAQEVGVYIVERILQVEEYGCRYSLDQGLVKAIVEVFKHGTPAARKIAESALARTNLLSVVSGGSKPA